MKIFYKIINKCLMLFVLAGCAATTYHLDAGVVFETYTEGPTTGDLASFLSSNLLGSPVSVVSGDPHKFHTTGTGFRLGFIEDTKYLKSTLAFTKTNFKTLNHVFSINSINVPVNTTIETVLLDLTLGPKLWWFSPHFAYKFGSLDLESSGASSFGDTTVGSLLGYGVDLAIPFSSIFNLNLRYQNLSSKTSGFGHTIKTEYKTIGASISVKLGTINKK